MSDSPPRCQFGSRTAKPCLNLATHHHRVAHWRGYCDEHKSDECVQGLPFDPEQPERKSTPRVDASFDNLLTRLQWMHEGKMSRDGFLEAIKIARAVNREIESDLAAAQAEVESHYSVWNELAKALGVSGMQIQIPRFVHDRVIDMQADRDRLRAALESVENILNGANHSRAVPQALGYLERFRAETLAGGGSGWSSMESAPCDGTAILAMLPDSEMPAIIRWHDATGMACASRWIIVWDGEHLGKYSQPTHWRPLPAAPTQKEVGE